MKFKSIESRRLEMRRRSFIKFGHDSAENSVMGMLDRYKKKGGFVQLLTLIETSGKQKQEQFLALVGQESPVWEEAIRERCLSLEKILSWDPSHLREIFSRLQPLTLATVIYGMSPEKTRLILSCMSVTDQRKVQLVLDESRPTPAEVGTCVLRIITETRGFILGGIIKMEKIDPALMIPENFEEQLAERFAERAYGASPSAPTLAAVPSPGPEPAPDSKLEGRVDHHSKEEIEFLKKKVNQLVAENTSLKQELSLLRGKLDQIRKIA